MDELKRFRRIPTSLRTAACSDLYAVVLVVAAVLLTSTPVNASPPHCDRGLKPVGGKLGYQWRTTSNVCEGLYEAKVAASLEIVSYLMGGLDFQPSTHKVLDVAVAEIPDLASTDVFVRAVALLAGTYYRMDSALVGSERVSWSLDDVVGPADLGPDKLGIFGWVGSESEKIFVPLRVAPAGEQAAEGEQALELLIRPAVDIDYANWRAWTASLQPAGEGELPHGARAGRPFPILISSGPAAVLDVEVTAKEANRERWSAIRLRIMRAPR